jgi:hypothetical protein
VLSIRIENDLASQNEKSIQKSDASKVSKKKRKSSWMIHLGSDGYPDFVFYFNNICRMDVLSVCAIL